MDSTEQRHAHRFKLTAHMDGCHWWTTTAHCDCGAIHTQQGERDTQHDPYAAVWFDDQCERCAELLGGAKPIYRQTTTGPVE